jgi:hypothetical protein
MKKSKMACIAAVVVVSGLSAGAQTLALQLQAANYNPITGVWSDTSGNNNTATYYGLLPTLATGVTPNGSSAVGLNLGNGNGNGFSLTSSLAAGSGYTVFAFIEPVNTTGRHALTGGSNQGALEYDIYNGNQDFLREYLQDVGNGTATVSTSSFSLIDLAVSSTLAGSFRFNGSADGTTGSGTAFSSPITRIGNNEGGGDGFAGYIAEIDIYQGVMNSTQIGTVEAALTAEYVSPVPEPTTLALTAGGLGLLVAVRRFRRAQV